jgi:hypothetical protein
MDDVVAFVRARLDEDEAAAKAAWGIEWDWRYVAQPFGERPSIAHTVHIARHDPARVLREVEAKRAILDRHMPHETAFDGLACNWCSEDVDDRPQIAKERWPCPDARDLAAVWNDHPDYRQEWKP